MFRAILRGSIRKGLLKKPDEGDPDSFLPAYKVQSSRMSIRTCCSSKIFNRPVAG